MSLGPDWAYHITISHQDWSEVATWCHVNIGEFDQDWYKLGIDIIEWAINGKYETTWYFRREQDAVLFSLRWM